MVVASTLSTGHNAERPGGNRADTELSTIGCEVRSKEATNNLFKAHLGPQRKRYALMSQQYHRSRPEGRSHRARLRALVIPTLAVGQPVPTGRTLGWLLNINASEAWRHLRRVLAEEGIATETRGRGKGRRIYVISIRNWRVAA